MARLRFCLLFALLCSCSYGLGITTPKTEIINLPLLGASGDTNTTTSTTAAPTTTTSAPTTTTAAPTTTTAAPTTTTAAPTTTTPAPTTTTPAPTTTSPVPTTTTPAPTPAPAPTPVPNPEQGTWAFTDAKANVTCIVLKFAAQLNVTYTKVVEDATSLSSVLINVPVNATVFNGSCSDSDQWIGLNWNTSAESTMPNSVIFVFHKNDSIQDYALKSLNIYLSPDNFVNGSSTTPIELYHGAEWQTSLSTSYRCTVPTRFNMTSESTGVVGDLTLSKLQEQAYRTTPGKEFSTPRECGGGELPDAVPIAVGCALGGMVVVVLVAYLLGRRRSAARGYLSM